MGVSFKKGTFTKRTSTGSDNITTVGFQPKALIFWSSAQTVETFEEHISLSYGYSDGTNNTCVTYASEDNQATSDSYHNVMNNACIQLLTPADGVVLGTASVTAMLVDGFTINWSVANATAYVIHYI